MAYALRCPQCRQKFPWDPQLGMPKLCPMGCGYENEERADDDIVMPFIRSHKMKAADDVYRQMEVGSEVRAQAAAEMTGASVEDMSGLKITDLKSATREGDIAAVPVKNEVTKIMEAPAAGGPGWGFQGNTGVGFSANVQTGKFANSGAKFQTVLREKHAEATNWKGVGDNPALETFHPNYRRRG